RPRVGRPLDADGLDRTTGVVMIDTDDLRQALANATADPVFHIPAEQVRRRARTLRTRQHLRVAATTVLAVGVLTVPGVLFLGHAPAGLIVGASTPTCAKNPTLDPGSTLLGPRMDTGVRLDAPNLSTRFEVLFGLEGTVDSPMFAVAF